MRILIAFFTFALLGSVWILFDPPTTHIRYFTQTWSALMLVFLGISVLDARSVREAPDISIRRILPNTLSLHAWADVHLEVEHQFTRAQSITVFDDHPIGAQSKGLPIEIKLERSLTSRVSYRLRPMSRGDAHFHSAHVKSYSPLGLWKVASRSGDATTVRVYPNFAAVSRYGLIAIDHHTAQVGIKLRPRRGEGLEFHQLREYRLGDSMRQVDWKATARKNQLISKEYQDERDQQILFLLDCGRRMRAQDGELSHFDHALNAMLLLAHVVLHEGDAVGLLSFGDTFRWLPGKKGVGTVNTLLNSIYDLETTTLGSDYCAAAEELCKRQRRRSLVILLTNLRDESIEDLLPAIRLLKQHHLVLVANLREPALDETLSKRVNSFARALRYVGAQELISGRREIQDALRAGGVFSIDAIPSELPTELINHYYAIKRSGIL